MEDQTNETRDEPETGEFTDETIDAGEGEPTNELEVLEEDRLEEDHLEEDNLEEDGEEIEEVPERAAFPWSLVLGVGVLMLLVGMGLGYVGRGQFGPEAQAARVTAQAMAAAVQTQSAGSAEMMNYLIENTRHFKGDENAPVTIIEFSDFQCPYCGVFAGDAGLEIDQTYIQTGKVRFGYWNFTFLGEESEWAAQAAECAADQGKYWEYHDALFGAQSGENQGGFNKDNLKAMASGLGLDSATFDECLDSEKHAELIRADTGLAQQIGVQSTPSFLVNGSPLVGAQPFSAFEQLIESFLK